jgi:DNA helicase IV
VRLDSPYFGHLRLREDGRERDLCLGKGTFIERGVTVVDWRNAPISRIFYRYRQGEVQDLSPLEVRVLLDRLDEHRCMTLAGDTQQHVLADAGFTSWSDFFERFGLAGAEVSTLRVSYRSTRPIVEFATSVLGDLREDDELPLTTRDGPLVEYFRFTDPVPASPFSARR